MSRLQHSPNYYRIWKAVYFIIIIASMLGIYHAAQKADYIWRWYRVPQYFWTKEKIDIRAEISGTVASIESSGDKTRIVTVTGDDGSETYTVPTAGLKVAKGDFIFSGDVLGDYRVSRPGILLQGLWMTIKVSIIGIIFGILIGLVSGLARISDNPCFKWLAITYIELIRGSPLLVQIFLWYFVFGTLINKMLTLRGLPEIPGLWFGVASLAIFAGAYVAEIVRAGIQSIHRGQMEAAKSLGMTPFQSMRHIVLPQAFRRILPPLAGQFISLIKDSSLLGIIAIRELTKATREVVTTSLQPYELWFVCALLYLAITFSLSALTQYMERKLVQ
ncbi:MAG: polar amino acid transport system permease protein [Desulfovibrionales bacterium]|nr:polar amino acid transport system permease protein [Desulfovibrionales bacterium]